MRKRPFSRTHGLLLDEFEFAPGQPCHWTFPSTMLGEPLEASARRAALSSLAGGKGAALALSDDVSEEKVEALLLAARAGDDEACAELVAFVDDPRVRPVLIDAARAAPGPRLANIAQAVGRAGGLGAKDVLYERLAELEGDPLTWADDSCVNWRAYSLCVVAGGIVDLDPDAIRAAEALLRCLGHPCRANARTAARIAAEVFRPTIHTGAMRSLRRALAGCLHAEDVETFCAIAKAFAELEPQAVEERCEELLSRCDGARRAAIVGVLVHTRSPRLHAVAAQWVHTLPLRAAMEAAEVLGPVLSAQTVEDLARRALADDSPSLRWVAMRTLERMTPDAARALALEAEKDEPDPVLRALLARTGKRDAAK